MRHLRFLSMAFLLTALPVVTHASTTTPQCDLILSLPSISSYTQKVLARADAGLQNARTQPVSTEFLAPSWARDIQSAWLSLIDSQLRLTIQNQNLTSHTACLHFDLLQIECKLDEVRGEMNAQMDKHSSAGIQILLPLVTFLNERYAQLAQGALNPLYVDVRWQAGQLFDPPTSTTTVDPPLCPYDSDYAPPTLNGYGCDTETLQPLVGFPPAKDEYDALSLISSQINDYRSTAAAFLSVQRDIDALFNKTSTLPPPPAPRSHLSLQGCGAGGGFCENDNTIRCMQSTDCEGSKCLFPQKVCKNNRNITCLSDASCQVDASTNVGPCIDNDGEGPATSELRGPFSIQKNHIQILLNFLAQRIQQGSSRLFQDDLKTAGEFPASDGETRASRDSDTQSLFLSTSRSMTRALYALWSRIQGAREAATFPYATDPELETAESLTPLRTAISDLAHIAIDKGDKKGLRSFVIRYAYFLRLSCAYRPCNTSLDQVIKIAFADACFPYTNGDFLSDTDGDPRWKKCATEAGITLP